jgi:hypothetical protein
MYRLLSVLLILFPECGLFGQQTKKTVFIISDAEGVAGVCRQDQADPKDIEMLGPVHVPDSIGARST